MLKLFLAIGALTISCTALDPELVLYNTDNPEDATHTVITKLGNANQLDLPSEERAASVCVNSGNWILYPDASFQAETSPILLLTTGSEGPRTCQVLPVNLHKKLGSYRPAGTQQEDECRPLRLYAELNYAGEERFLTPSLDFPFKSFIKNDNCTWQLFTMEDYEGFSECLKAEYNFVPNFSDIFIFPPAELKSIKLGCDKKPTHQT